MLLELQAILKNKKHLTYSTAGVGLCKVTGLFKALSLSAVFRRLDSQLLHKQLVYFTFYRFARRHYLIACDCEYTYLASLILLAGGPHRAEPGSKQKGRGGEGRKMTQSCWFTAD